MIYLLETQLYDNNSIFFALKNVYGINKSTSFMICKKLGFSKNLKVKHLSKSQVVSILNLIYNLNISINDELRQFKILAVKNLVSIKSYRGLQRIKGFPIRGQRTRTNANTSKKIKF